MNAGLGEKHGHIIQLAENKLEGTEWQTGEKHGYAIVAPNYRN